MSIDCFDASEYARLLWISPARSAESDLSERDSKLLRYKAQVPSIILHSVAPLEVLTCCHMRREGRKCAAADSDSTPARLSARVVSLHARRRDASDAATCSLHHACVHALR